MAFTQADLDALDRAIVRGEKTVQFADRSTTYKSTAELLEARAHVAAQLAQAAGRTKQTLGYSTSGL